MNMAGPVLQTGLLCFCGFVESGYDPIVDSPLKETLSTANWSTSVVY